MSEERSGSELARQLAARRKISTRSCAVCGKEMAGIALARYCSNACRQKAKYRRQRGLPIPDERDVDQHT